jgi:predicted transposase/invertase (TIGR01784 family)
MKIDPFDEQIEIDPRVDWVCKMLIGHEQRTHITTHFLNAALKPSVPIRSVVIQNPINEKESDDDKLSVLDIVATDEVGAIFNIEIQRFLHACLAERLTYYLAVRFAAQLYEGDGYRFLRPAIGICILDAVMLPADMPYHNEFRMRNSTGYDLAKSLQINILELPKYQPVGDNEPIDDPLDQWMYFFKFAQGSTTRDLSRKLPDPIFDKAVEVLHMIQRNPDDRYIYEMRQKAERDRAAFIEHAEAMGEARGEARGKVIGETRGKARGFLMGKIVLLQQLLSTPETEETEFSQMDLQAMEELLRQLQSQLRDRS